MDCGWDKTSSAPAHTLVALSANMLILLFYRA